VIGGHPGFPRTPFLDEIPLRAHAGGWLWKKSDYVEFFSAVGVDACATNYIILKNESKFMFGSIFPQVLEIIEE
jgi:hypothetical protein